MTIFDHSSHSSYKADFLFVKNQGHQSHFGILFWLLIEHFVQIWGKKLRCIFHLLAILKINRFVCNSIGNRPVESILQPLVWSINWVITQKRTLILLIFFQKLLCNYLRTWLSWSHLGPWTQGIKSLLSPCDYTMMSTV